MPHMTPLNNSPRFIQRLLARPAAALLATLCVTLPAIAQGPPPTAVRFGEVRMEPVQVIRQVTGELRATKRSAVAAEEGGLLVALNVEEGDAVNAGEIIAQQDTTLITIEFERLQAELKAWEATATQRRAHRDNAQRDRDRIQQLLDSGGTTESELDAADTDLIEAQASLAQASADVLAAKAAVVLAQQRINKMAIKAPFAGVVVAKNTEVGQWLAEGDVLIELVSTGTIDAWLDVPERFSAGLAAAKGTSVSITLTIDAARQTMETADYVVIPDVDPLARTFPLRVRMSNADSTLSPGMAVIGLVPTGDQNNAITVPKDAVLRNEAGAYVLFDAGGVAAPSPVEVLYAVGERSVVHAPSLAPGMRVIVEGNERLFPGMPIMDQQAPPPAQSAAPSAVPEDGSPENTAAATRAAHKTIDTTTHNTNDNKNGA